MSGRDPRVTPRAGDVLRKGRTNSPRYVVRNAIGGPHMEPIVEFCFNDIERTHCLGLERWRRWAAGAEVLMTGEEVQGG